MNEPQLPVIGARAPDFTAAASDGSTVSLSSLLERGPAVLFFYPGNDTPG
jgi:thioredoxin-dependent peroxiredoxin